MNVPVLMMYEGTPDPRIDADAQVDALEGPERLLAAAAARLLFHGNAWKMPKGTAYITRSKFGEQA